MLGVFLDRETVDRNDLDFTSLDNSLDQWRFYGTTRPDELHARIKDADVIISNKVMLDRAALEAAPKLRLICLAATGTNNVDIAAAQARGIVVSNVRAYATASVSQHCFALMLSLSIHLGKYRRAVMRGAWQRSPYFCLLDYPIEELAGKTLGIIGYGELGQAVARIATAFDMHVIISDHRGAEPRPGRTAFDEVLATADIISLHCPLTHETQKLIGATEIARMKPGAMLINTARGGLIDEAALADALRSGHLGAVGLDVIGKEPPDDDHLLLAGDIPNLIITPHIAWASRTARQRLIEEISANINAFLAGTPRNAVTT